MYVYMCTRAHTCVCINIYIYIYIYFFSCYTYAKDVESESRTEEEKIYSCRGVLDRGGVGQKSQRKSRRARNEGSNGADTLFANVK